jgi:hypothetical protein
MTSPPFRSALLLGLLGLAACGSNAPAARPVAGSGHDAYRYKDEAPGKLSDTGGPAAGISRTGRPEAEQGSGIGVNAYLWRGALDTLGFMPLASADPFGGTIITDWYSPPTTSGERFKATAYVLGRQLRADGVRVALFRQVQEDGRWVDAPVSPTTTGEIENRVLARARELRADATGHSG